MNYLIDTNAISELVKPRPNHNVVNWFKSIPPENIFLSVLTIGEIRYGITKIQDSAKKEKLRIWLEHELPKWLGDRLLTIDLGVSEYWGRLLAKHKRTLPAIDSLLAATALHADLSLVTRNIDDFQVFSDLIIVNPWDI